MLDLTCSIVLYNTNPQEIQYIVGQLLKTKLQIKVFLIDNSKTDILKDTIVSENVTYIFNNKNVGYGAGHNLAIFQVKDLAKYHLILNSDIEFDSEILEKSYAFMEENKNVGLLSPKILTLEGNLQYFSRKLPTPFDLFTRRFMPKPIRDLFKSRLDGYLLKFKDYSKQMIVPNLPGCFMFVRMDILIAVNAFDGNFFMYIEDVDLTRRIYQKSLTLYYPEIEVKHALAQGSYKFSKLLMYHINSAFYYFNKWGWFNDKERYEINKSLNQ